MLSTSGRKVKARTSSVFSNQAPRPVLEVLSERREGRLKNMTLRQLRLFEAVAETLSFSRAAERMHVTQPAVSMQVQQLELALGLVLLVKHGRNVSLSQAGEEMLLQARRILNQIRLAEDAVHAFDSVNGQNGGLLHLGVVPTANYFAPRLLMAFAEKWPGAQFKLTVEHRDTILRMLKDHQIDVAIGGYPPSEADLAAETFARHPHCIVASANHPLSKISNVKWHELRDQPFLFREPHSATRQFFEHILQAQALQVKVSMELSGNESIKQAVIAGMGISFMSAHSFQIELDANRISVLQLEGMPKTLDWCLLTRRDSSLAGVNLAFRSFVLESGASIAECRLR